MRQRRGVDSWYFEEAKPISSDREITEGVEETETLPDASGTRRLTQHAGLPWVGLTYVLDRVRCCTPTTASSSSVTSMIRKVVTQSGPTAASLVPEEKVSWCLSEFRGRMPIETQRLAFDARPSACASAPTDCAARSRGLFYATGCREQTIRFHMFSCPKMGSDALQMNVIVAHSELFRGHARLEGQESPPPPYNSHPLRSHNRGSQEETQ